MRRRHHDSWQHHAVPINLIPGFSQPPAVWDRTRAALSVAARSAASALDVPDGQDFVGTAATLGNALIQAIKVPEVRERFDRLALDPSAQGPDEFRARVISDSERWHKIAAEAGIKPAD